MDEEQEILQSNLEQSEKISIGNFFGSPIGGLANRAVTQSNTSLKSSITNRNLIATLQSSIELLRGQLQQITNYILVDRQERRQIVNQRELEAFEREDAIQKGIIGQSRNLEDAQPFFPENRFSQGLTAGMSSIGEPKGVAKFQQDVLGIEARGSRSFFFGGLVPGIGNADTVDAKLTPGEFVIPKDKVEDFTPNFLSGLIKAGGGENNKSVNPFKVEDTNTPDFSLLTAISALEGGDSQARVDVAQSVYNRLNEVKKDIGDGPGTTAITDYTRDSFVSDESGVFPEPTLSDVLLKDKQYQPAFIDPNISDTDDPRTNVSPEFLNVSNKETAIQAMKSYYDKRGDERSMEDIESLYDKTVIDLQDQKLNKNASAFVGGNTEFLSGKSFKEGDQYRGKMGVDNTFFSKFGTGTQLETGAAISPLIKNPLKDFEAGAATEVSDEEAKKLIQSEEGENPLRNMLSPLTKKLENFTKSDTAKNLKNMADTDALGLENMANKASEVIGGKEGLESLKNDIISIVGNQLFNKITSDKEDKEDKEDKVDFSVSPDQSGKNEKDIAPNESSGKVVQPAPSESRMSDVTSNESIKEAAQSLMTPPPPPQSETIELPPQIQGDTGDGGGIQGGVPPFKPSTPSHDQLTGTESPLTFVEVISNPFLSIP